MPPALRVIAIPSCSSLTAFLWQCNWQASAVKTSNSSFFIWRHFVGFNQGFNWQAGSGWVAPGAGAQRRHWLSRDTVCAFSFCVLSSLPLSFSFLSFLLSCFLSSRPSLTPPYSGSYLLMGPQISSQKSICLFLYSVFSFYTFVLSVNLQKHSNTVLHID